jgi:hypothetical protein
MFMRFVVTQIDEDSRQPQGVFSAAYALLESGRLDADEARRLREELSWFEENLPAPSEHFCAWRAVFWFKAGAREQVCQAWGLACLLRLHGLHVEVYKCRRLANLVYEDAGQVAAYPSKRDGRIAR